VSHKAIPISSGQWIDGSKKRHSADSRADGALAMSIAHEISNPLDALLNLLYLVESEATLTEAGRHYLMQAREEVGRIAQIAHTALKEFRDTRHRVTESVPNLLEAVVTLYKSRLDSQGISIATRYPVNGNLAVHPGPLRQMFSNLLLNAADAMPQGGRLHARVAAAQEWAGKKRHGLRVTLADNGCGIAPDQLHKVFEPFFTTKGPLGNGVGLSLVQDVVRKHDGVLRVRSGTRPGHSGSVFAIFLPEA
jgi:signal transduction histidine kinase